MTLCVLGDDFYSGSANGNMQRWDKEFHLVSTWPAHGALVLTSATRTRNGRHLITGGSDAVIKVCLTFCRPGRLRVLLSLRLCRSGMSSMMPNRWSIRRSASKVAPLRALSPQKPITDQCYDRLGPMFHALSKFVAFRTIADENHREECRQGALYLKRLLSELGATASIVRLLLFACPKAVY